MKLWRPTFAFLAALFTSLALAEDFKTVDGKEYKDATVSRVEPDAIVVTSKSGICKIYFAELPKAVQERFHYDPEKAAAALAAAVQQTEEVNAKAAELDRQRKELDKERQSELLEQKDQERNIQRLKKRVATLQQQEEELLAEIGRVEERQEDARRRWIKSGHGSTGQMTDPEERNLPLLRSRLDNVREEKYRVKQDLERALRQP